MDECEENEGPLPNKQARMDSTPDVKVGKAKKDKIVEDLRSPMHNPLILNHVFQYLDMKDIRTCRLVSSRWNAIANSYFEKTVIQAGFAHVFNEPHHRSLINFRRIFENSNVRFRSFIFASFEDHYGPWPLGWITKFLDTQKETVRALRIENIRISGGVGEEKAPPYIFESYFDLTPVLYNQLTTLIISNKYGNKFIVDLDKMTKLNYIVLEHCAIDITNGGVLTAKHVELNEPWIFDEEDPVQDFLLHEHLNFEKLESLILEGNTSLTIIPASLGTTDVPAHKGKVVQKENHSSKTWMIKGRIKLRKISFDPKTRLRKREICFEDETTNLKFFPNECELHLQKFNCTSVLPLKSLKS